MHRRSDCTLWHASVGYVSDIVGGTAGDFDGRSFSVGLTAFETIDPLNGNHDNCRLWRDIFFEVLKTKG